MCSKFITIWLKNEEKQILVEIRKFAEYLH